MNTRLAYIGVLVIILIGLFFAIPTVKPPVPTTPADQYSDLIRVTAPQANDTITSPLLVAGQARGQWYFEASFPVRLEDANGVVLVQAPAQAQGEWMTTEFVPFSVALEFAPPTTNTGFLVLHNDNPSGLPENDKEVRIPIVFAQVRDPGTAVFGADVQLAVGDQVRFPDGLTVSLSEINDSRCPQDPNVNCVWQGELSAALIITGGKVAAVKTIRIGTVQATTLADSGYTFSLQSATPQGVIVQVR